MGREEKGSERTQDAAVLVASRPPGRARQVRPRDEEGVVVRLARHGCRRAERRGEPEGGYCGGEKELHRDRLEYCEDKWKRLTEF